MTNILHWRYCVVVVMKWLFWPGILPILVLACYCCCPLYYCVCVVTILTWRVLCGRWLVTYCYVISYWNDITYSLLLTRLLLKVILMTTCYCCDIVDIVYCVLRYDVLCVKKRIIVCVLLMTNIIRYCCDPEYWYWRHYCELLLPWPWRQLQPVLRGGIIGVTINVQHGVTRIIRSWLLTYWCRHANSLCSSGDDRYVDDVCVIWHDQWYYSIIVWHSNWYSTFGGVVLLWNDWRYYYWYDGVTVLLWWLLLCGEKRDDDIRMTVLLLPDRQWWRVRSVFGGVA